ncbi:MAG: DUF411 domain-containing protein [bacterium]|nr:DUF411 domain-containing protein [bacterium]
MQKKIILIIVGLVIIGGVFYVSSSLLKNNTANISNIKNELGGDNKITVFKSPTCSCCADYIKYLKKEGFDVKVENVNNMLSIKEKYQVPTELESCHTSIIRATAKDEEGDLSSSPVGNYFVEGHVPIEVIKKLLTEKPALDGIALPGMPSGAPGMSGPKTGEFKIYGISKGEITEFTTF